MTATAGTCPHCHAQVIHTRSAVTGNRVALDSPPIPGGLWQLDQAGYAYPDRGVLGYVVHQCQEMSD